jgi:hypothetical protein
MCVFGHLTQHWHLVPLHPSPSGGDDGAAVIKIVAFNHFDAFAILNGSFSSRSRRNCRNWVSGFTARCSAARRGHFSTVNQTAAKKAVNYMIGLAGRR